MSSLELELLRQSIFYFIVWQCTVRHYHGSLGYDERQSAHVAFLNGTAPVIVATVAFGMGIDKPDIRRSGHYALWNTAYIGFCDRLVVISSWIPLDLATPFGLMTLAPLTEAGRKTQCGL